MEEGRGDGREEDRVWVGEEGAAQVMEIGRGERGEGRRERGGEGDMMYVASCVDRHMSRPAYFGITHDKSNFLYTIHAID